jgi:hypothetical protein
MNKIEIIQEFNKIERNLYFMIKKLLSKCYSDDIMINSVHIDIVNKIEYVEEANFTIHCGVMTSVGLRNIKIKVHFDMVEACNSDNYLFECYYTSNENAKELRDYLFDVE